MDAQPWLFRRATERTIDERESHDGRYDERLQMTVVPSANGERPAIEMAEPPASKKADIEKGEDQKDRWR